LDGVRSPSPVGSSDQGHHDGSREQQTIRIDTPAQCGKRQPSQNRTNAGGAQQDTIKAGITAQHVTRHQRKRGPDSAGDREENSGSQKYDMQRTTNVPMLPRTVAAQSTANAGWRNGAKPPDC
jgi:hypothetical protein